MELPSPSPQPSPPSATRAVTSQTAVGVTLVLLSPIVFFFAFAFAAVVFGEPRVESGGDLAWVSYAALLATVGIGLVLVAADLLGRRVRLGRVSIAIALLALLVGVGAVCLGVVSIIDASESSDPSIGAAFLLVVGFGLIIVAAIALAWRRSTAASG